MNDEKLSEMSLEELSRLTKEALSLIYQKLRNEEGFGYYQRCLVTSIGSGPYDVGICIVDTSENSSNGIHYDPIYWL